MRAGPLDVRIDVQRRTVTQSPSGETIEAWTTLSTRPAKLEALQADERFGGEQLISKAQYAFTIRWSTVVDDLSPLDRIVYPSVLSNSPPTIRPNTVYDIIAVNPIGRNEALKILTVVHQDWNP